MTLLVLLPHNSGTTMETFSSKDLAMRAQKKILSSMATRSSVQMFIDDTTSEILDELYHVSRGFTGNKTEAQKVIKDLVKIAVKIGVLFRNNRFSVEELKVAQEFKKKLNQGAMTAISFYEVRRHRGIDFTNKRTNLMLHLLIHEPERQFVDLLLKNHRCGRSLLSIRGQTKHLTISLAGRLHL